MTASIMFWAVFAAFFKENAGKVFIFCLVVGVGIALVQGIAEGYKSAKHDRATAAAKETKAKLDKAIACAESFKTVVAEAPSRPSVRMTATAQPVEFTDPRDIDCQEVTIPQLQKRLNALYNRRDRLEYINGTTPENWKKFQSTKTYRGLEWDIQDTEERLERAIKKEKERWAKA